MLPPPEDSPLGQKHPCKKKAQVKVCEKLKGFKKQVGGLRLHRKSEKGFFVVLKQTLTNIFVLWKFAKLMCILCSAEANFNLLAPAVV